MALEVFPGMLDELEEALELKYHEGAEALLLRALINAFQEGLRVGIVDAYARLQPHLKEGIVVIPVLDGIGHFDPPEGES